MWAKIKAEILGESDSDDDDDDGDDDDSDDDEGAAPGQPQQSQMTQQVIRRVVGWLVGARDLPLGTLSIGCMI